MPPLPLLLIATLTSGLLEYSSERDYVLLMSAPHKNLILSLKNPERGMYSSQTFIRDKEVGKEHELLDSITLLEDVIM